MITNPDPPTGNGGIISKGPPDNVLDAAKVLAEYAAVNGARYWEIGMTCSRLYAMGVQAFVPKLKKIRGALKDTPEIHAHNAAVAALKQMVDRRADAVFFDLLKKASGK